MLIRCTHLNSSELISGFLKKIMNAGLSLVWESVVASCLPLHQMIADFFIFASSRKSFFCSKSEFSSSWMVLICFRVGHTNRSQSVCCQGCCRWGGWEHDGFCLRLPLIACVSGVHSPLKETPSWLVWLWGAAPWLTRFWCSSKHSTTLTKHRGSTWCPFETPNTSSVVCALSLFLFDTVWQSAASQCCFSITWVMSACLSQWRKAHWSDFFQQSCLGVSTHSPCIDLLMKQKKHLESCQCTMHHCWHNHVKRKLSCIDNMISAVWEKLIVHRLRFLNWRFDAAQGFKSAVANRAEQKESHHTLKEVWKVASWKNNFLTHQTTEGKTCEKVTLSKNKQGGWTTMVESKLLSSHHNIMKVKHMKCLQLCQWSKMNQNEVHCCSGLWPVACC